MVIYVFHSALFSNRAVNKALFEYILHTNTLNIIMRILRTVSQAGFVGFRYLFTYFVPLFSTRAVEDTL
jgi:hypothetical protein